jgi:putative spermidine/putrescine transport system permease protein
MRGFPGIRTWGERSPLPGVLAAVLLASPVVVGLVYVSLGAVGVVGPGADGSGVSFDRVGSVLGDPAVWEGTLWTLWVAGASTALAMVAAAGVAVVFRGRGWTARLGRILAFLPLPVPHLAAGVGGLLVLGQSGILSRIGYQLGWIGVPSDMPALVMDPVGIGLIVALTWKEIPFLSLVAVSVLETRGEGLEETARDLGAGLFDVVGRVTWPLLWRGMLPAALAVFTFVAGSYEAAVLLAPSDPLALPLMTWERYTDAALSLRADAYVLSLLSLVLVMVAVAVHEWMRARFDGGSGS